MTATGYMAGIIIQTDFSHAGLMRHRRDALRAAKSALPGTQHGVRNDTVSYIRERDRVIRVEEGSDGQRISERVVWSDAR